MSPTESRLLPWFQGIDATRTLPQVAHVTRAGPLIEFSQDEQARAVQRKGSYRDITNTGSCDVPSITVR